MTKVIVPDIDLERISEQIEPLMNMRIINGDHAPSLNSRTLIQSPRTVPIGPTHHLMHEIGQERFARCTLTWMKTSWLAGLPMR